MVSADVPYVEVQYLQVAASNVAQSDILKPVILEENCREVGNSDDYVVSAYNNFVVGGAVFTALGYRYNERTKSFDLPERVRSNYKSYVLYGPSHGKVFQSEADKKQLSYSYQAEAGYTGKDLFVIAAEALSRSGKPVYFNLRFKLSVVDAITNEKTLSTCAGMKFDFGPSSVMQS